MTLHRVAFLSVVLLLLQLSPARANVRLTQDTFSSERPVVAIDAGGAAVVVWQDNRDGNYEIYWQRFSRAGVTITNAVRITDTPDKSVRPDVSCDGNGNSYIVWQEGESVNSVGTVYFAVVDPNGAFTVSPIALKTFSGDARICTRSDGTSAVVWHHFNVSDQDVYFQRLSSAGVLLCQERFNKNTIPGMNKTPSVASVVDGSWVYWRDMDFVFPGLHKAFVNLSCGVSFSPVHQHNNNVYPDVDAVETGTQRWMVFERSGRIYGESVCAIAGSGNATRPRVGTDGSKGFVTWRDTRDGNSEIYMCRFDGCTNEMGDTRLTIDIGASQNPDIAVLNDGSAKWVVVWQDNRDGNWEIYLDSNFVPPVIPCASADLVMDFSPGSGTSHVSAENTLGLSDGEAVPLGLEGSVTLRLGRAVIDEPGPDFYVHENGADDGAIDENFRVEVSQDNVTFAVVGEGDGGTAGFDLAASGLSRAYYVRITDLLPQEGGTAPPEVGADIDAVEVVVCGKPDFVIENVVVAQAVVSPNLIRGKDTVVRAYLKNLREPLETPTPLTGRLHVLDENETELFTRDADSDVVWPADGNPFDPTDTELGRNTLNFYLQAAEVTHSNLKFWVELDTGDAVEEEDETNNSSEATPVTQNFHPPKRIRIAYCTVSQNDEPTYQSKMSTGYGLIAQTYPVSFDPSEDWKYEVHVPFFEGPFEWVNNARAILKLTLHTLNTNELAAFRPRFARLVGFFDDWPFAGVPGKSVMGEAVILVDDDVDPNLIRQTIAHEMGHTYRLKGEYHHYDSSSGYWYADDRGSSEWKRSECEPGRPFPCINYPPQWRQEGIVKGRFVSESAFNIAKKRPAAWGSGAWNHPSVRSCLPIYDVNNTDRVLGWRCEEDENEVADNRTVGFMGSLLGDQFAWITNDVYELLVDELNVSGPAPPFDFAPSRVDSNQIWLVATIASDDQVVAGNWRLLESPVPVDPLEGTGYSVDFIGPSDVTLASHPFGISFDEEDPALLVERFPYPDASTRIEIRKAGTPIYVRNLSTSTPTVEVITPNGGGVVSGSVTVTWTASDADGDSLKADAFFSRDDGATWLPIAFDISGSSLQWNTASAPGTQTGRIRVRVSDGIRTAEDMSDSTFSIGGKPPQVTISAPEDSADVVVGQAVAFEAVFIDPEDGTAPGADLLWTSNLDDTLGMGATVEVSSLQVGQHTIVVAGADYDGIPAQDTITIDVLADSDGDGMPDEWEDLYPELDASTPDGYVDVDDDRLSNRDEYYYGTIPNNNDSDGDGWDDGSEIAASTDPLSAASNPTAVGHDIIDFPVAAEVGSYPNPFNPQTTIRFTVPVQGRTSLCIYDVNGKLVNVLVHGPKTAGKHRVLWNGRNLRGNEVASGVYFIRLETVSGTATSKAVILR